MTNPTKLINSLLAIAMFFCTASRAQDLPEFFERVELASGLDHPTVMAHLPDGRILIGEQPGDIKIYENGAVLPDILVHVPTARNGERGLGGMTLHPDYATNGYLYVYFTEADGTNNVIWRYTVQGSTTIDPTVILILDPTVNTNHNGGAMLFGTDGKLYVAVGESNVPANTEDLDTYHGKILRLNEDGTPAEGNPYYGTGTLQRQSIWAMGMRNPWTMDIHKTTNQILAIDVGGNYEEINDVTNPDPTKNYDYGWGAASQSGPEPDQATTIASLYSYPHTDGRCSIVDGYWYDEESSNWPDEYKNKYFFTDWCRADIWVIDPTDVGAGIQTFSNGGASNATGSRVGPDGNIYYFHWAVGLLYRIEYNNVSAPIILQDPIGDHYLCDNNNSTATIPAGQNLTLSFQATGAETLVYQWLKNGVEIDGATNETLVLSDLTEGIDNGAYSVYVSNNQGNVTSTDFTLTVSAYSTPPEADILTPTNGVTYAGGDSFDFSGQGVDVEDGVTDATKIGWEIHFNHADSPETEHWHPGPIVDQGVSSGSFTTATNGETSPNVWYEILMFVEDASGLRDTATKIINPRLSTITATTVPEGLDVLINGIGVAPRTIQSVENMDAFLEAVESQTIGTSFYEFSHWEHGGDRVQTLSTPIDDATYTAVYNESIITEVELSPTDDAYARGGEYENQTMGTTNPTELVTKMLTVPNETYHRDIYLTFDLSGISQVQEATLELFNLSSPPGAVSIYALSDTTWDENTLTWANKPAYAEPALATTNVTVANQYYPWTITDYIQQQLTAGADLVSFVLRNDVETGPQAIWNSKEAADNSPKLNLVMDQAVGVSEVLSKPESHLAVYPNPTSGVITVHSGSAEAWISILDLMGRVLNTQPAALGLNTIDLSNNALGTYIVELTDDHGAVRRARVQLK